MEGAIEVVHCWGAWQSLEQQGVGMGRCQQNNLALKRHCSSVIVASRALAKHRSFQTQHAIGDCHCCLLVAPACWLLLVD
eukprot:5280778-Lingulodinium_polyedra.AAC.1